MTMHSLSDNREDIVQKKREGVALEFAGFWRRLAASLIDLFAVAVIFRREPQNAFFRVWGAPVPIYH